MPPKADLTILAPHVDPFSQQPYPEKFRVRVGNLDYNARQLRAHKVRTGHYRDVHEQGLTLDKAREVWRKTGLVRVPGRGWQTRSKASRIRYERKQQKQQQQQPTLYRNQAPAGRHRYSHPPAWLINENKRLGVPPERYFTYDHASSDNEDAPGYLSNEREWYKARVREKRENQTRAAKTVLHQHVNHGASDLILRKLKRLQRRHDRGPRSQTH